MAHCIDAVDHSMETANREPMVHGVFSQAQIHQLQPRNNAMLPLRQPSDTRINTLRPPRAHARPREPAYFAG